MGAVAATLGATQLVALLQSKPANQPIAQTPTQPIPVPVETPVASPSPLPITTPEVSPSVSLETPVASPIPSPSGQIESPTSLLQGQNTVSITEMNCLTTNAAPNYESFKKSSKDTTKNLTIGQEVVTTVATLSSLSFRNEFGSDIAISPSIPAGVACQINPPNSSFQFRTLTLVFGISNTSLFLGQASKVRLTAFSDQKNVGAKEITRGGKQYWNIDISNVQNIALQAECTKGNNYTNRSTDNGDTYRKEFELCPALVFTQADLK